MISGGVLFGQEGRHFSMEANYFYGNIIEHNPHISHLITRHPEGVLLSFNKKTTGREAWENDYNYPQPGISFTYQDLKNPFLGENYGLYAHLGFYFFNRHLLLKAGQGLALATRPYRPDENYINNAYGSRLLSSTFFSGSFQKENIYQGVGFQLGVSMIHYSNADFKSPNNSTNTLAAHAGFNYIFDQNEDLTFVPKEDREEVDEPVRFNFALRSGANTMGIIGSKLQPFFTFSAFAEKIITTKSTLQGGAEFFLSRAMEEYIYYRSVAYPEENRTGQEDAKRAGIFMGHRLNIHKLSLLTHIGYYFYYPYEEYVEQVYNRIGLQHPLYKNLFGSVSVRSHWANAEAVEFSIGYKL